MTLAKRSLFVGNTDKDVYLRNGQVLGPGNVEVEESDYDDFALCVRRVQLNRPENERVDVTAVGTPPAVPVTEATVEQLQAMLAVKLRDAGVEPVDTDEVQATADRQVEDANRAAQQAHDRAAEAERQAEEAARTAAGLQAQIDQLNKAADAAAKAAAATAAAKANQPVTDPKTGTATTDAAQAAAGTKTA